MEAARRRAFADGAGRQAPAESVRSGLVARGTDGLPAGAEALLLGLPGAASQRNPLRRRRSGLRRRTQESLSSPFRAARLPLRTFSETTAITRSSHPCHR